jgi:hypothetical protein
MAQSGSKRPAPKAQQHALMMRAVPYFAQDMGAEEIAKLFRKSRRTVARWRQHPDVRKALGEVSEAVVDATKVAAVELVELAWQTLRDVMRSGEDERTRVTAAQVVLDRTGHGPTSKQELSGPQGAPLTVTFERAEDIVRAEQLLREVKR